MSTLIKLSNISFTPGSPHVPGSPGRPYRPGYFRTETYTEVIPVRGTTSVGVDGTFGFNVIIGYVNQTTTAKIWVPEQLAVAPTPAQAATPPITTELNIGWNGGADTTARFEGGAVFSFTIPASAVGAVVGLSSVSANGAYKTIPHGLYASRGTVRVVENGMLGAVSASYADSTPMLITRQAGTVTYTVGGVVLKTSADTLSELALGTAALYAPNDSVSGASMRQLGSGAEVALEPVVGFGSEGEQGEAAVSLEHITLVAIMRGTSSAAVVLEPIGTLIGADGRSSGAAHVRLEGIQGEASGRPMNVSAVRLEPIELLAADRPYTEASVALEPLTTRAEDGGLTPDFSAAFVSTAYIVSAGIMSTRTPLSVDVVLQPIVSLAADRPYAQAVVTLESLESVGYEFLNILINEITAPSPRLRATGFDATGDNAASLRAPSPTLFVQAGHNARLTAPRAQLAITGTFTNFGRASLSAPSATLEATGTVSGTGATSPFFAAPMGTLIGYGGAVCSITLTGKAQLEATGTLGSIGGAAITAPLFELVASGTAQNYGGADLLAPMGKMGGQGQAWLIAPMGRLVAIGSATVTATFDAYAVNLNHPPRRAGQEEVDEVTRYTNFPFTHIVRYQNSYFGAAADGLYLLEGTTDDGAAIPYNVRTCLTDFDTSAKKTVVSAYFGARFGPEAVVSLHAGEKTPNVYTYATPRGATAQNHRQTFGRGVKERYFALGVSGTNELELDSIEFEVAILTRRI